MKQVVAGGVGFDLVGTVRKFKGAPVPDGQAVFGCFPGRSGGRRRAKLDGSCNREPKKVRVTGDNTASTPRFCASALCQTVVFAGCGAAFPSVIPFANPPRPMALSPQDVSRIAHLARLELSPAEQAAMLTQLNGFFGQHQRHRATLHAAVGRAGSGPAAA
jgi:hypothetical protein